MLNEVLRIKDTPKEVNFLRIIFVLSLFLWGGFLPAVSCGLSVLLCLFIFNLYLTKKTTVVRQSKKKKKEIVKEVKAIKIPIDPVVIFLAVMLFLFILTCIWAVDKGMAPYGLIKYLPLPLFAIALHMTEDKGRETLLMDIPYLGALMTILSGLLALIPAIRDQFIVFGRLAGFMQYSNAFAILCLVGSAVLLLNEKTKVGISSIVTCAVLYAGIALSGSRTVFVLWVISIPVILILRKDKKLTIMLLSLAAVFVIASVVYVAVSGKFNAIGRFLTTSADESTFVGRFLYYKDALPVILSHPFGLGYKGYQALQTSFQTGVYHVQYIHNDYLQVFLDTGWITGLGGIACLVLALKKIAKQPVKFIPALMIALHILFDFDLQFIGIGFILIILLSSADYKEITVESKSVAILMVAACSLFSLYLGVADSLYLAGQNNACLAVYPRHTDALTMELTKKETVKELDDYSDRILRLNDASSIAYSAKARAAFAQGNVQSMIYYKLKAIGNYKYNLAEYTDFIDYLNRSVEIYLGIGEEDKAMDTMRYFVLTDKMLEDVKSSTSDLAYKINDKPDLELPDSYRTIVDAYKDYVVKSE